MKDYSNYRYPGEFEPQSDVFVTWIPDDIVVKGYDNKQPCVDVVKNLVDHVQVHVNCGTEGALESCKAVLKKNGVDIDQVIFTQFADSSFYFRDNGPSVMVDDKGGRVAVNPNWSNYSVDTAECESSKIARRAGVYAALSLDCYDIINSDMVSEGGDREFNGDGVLIAIEDTECRKRNPQYTKEEVEAEYKRIYNLDKIIWLPQPLYEDDDFRMGPLEYRDGEPYFGSSFAAHADEMCRFIDRNKILLIEVTEEEAAKSEAARESKKRIDAAYEILKNETDAHGNPFEIIRMPSPVPIDYIVSKEDAENGMFTCFLEKKDGRFVFQDGTPWPDGDAHFFAACGYCNFLICNDVVIGQRYYKEGMDPVIKEKDEKAEAVLKACFPDRNVIMIDSLALNLTGGGVHCWTKNVAAAKVEK